MRKLLQVPRLQDWIDLIIGFALAATPSALSFTDVTYAAWSAWGCAAIIMIGSTLALLAFEQREEWYGIAVGVWLIAAPFVLGFSGIKAPLAVHIVFGVVIIACETWEIWQVRHEPKETPAPI